MSAAPSPPSAGSAPPAYTASADASTSAETAMDAPTPRTPDGDAEPRASCSNATCSNCQGPTVGTKEARPRRLVWCLDATGRDGNLVERLLSSHMPSADSIEESYHFVLPRLRTNVHRLYEELCEADVRTQYYAGCGTTPKERGEWQRCTTGSDWMRIVAAAYRDLLHAYDYGDPVVLVGFSRGALACRAIAQILETIGLVPICTVVDGRPCEDVIGDALQAYDDLFHGRRRKRARATIAACSAALKRARAGKPGTSPTGGTLVEALFIFDTVQSFWFPRCLGFSGGQGVWRRMFGYEPEIVPPNVQRAYHACALGEQRIDYPLTPLVAPTPPSPDSALLELREVHFSGSHSDIGGGLIQRDLADVALGWMAAQMDRVLPGLVPTPSFDPCKRGARFWLDLCDGHIDAYGELAPFRYPVKLSDGLELVCSIATRPRPRHYAKLVHASVPEALRHSLASDSVAIAVAPLEPAELLIKSRWALEDDSSRSHRTVAGNVRKLMSWAETTDRKIAAAGRYSMHAIGNQIGHARHGFDTAMGHAGALAGNARTMAGAQIHSARTMAGAQMTAARTSVSGHVGQARHQLARLSLTPSTA